MGKTLLEGTHCRHVPTSSASGCEARQCSCRPASLVVCLLGLLKEAARRHTRHFVPSPTPVLDPQRSFKML